MELTGTNRSRALLKQRNQLEGATRRTSCVESLTSRRKISRCEIHRLRRNPPDVYFEYGTQHITLSRNVQQIYILLCGFQSTNSDRFSGDSYEDPPVPISNTVVKLINAESTWLETAREDRKSLIEVKAHLRVCLFLCVRLPILPGYPVWLREEPYIRIR